MRPVLAVFLLAACGPKPASGPAWPKQAERETDGGESIAPRAKASAVAAAEEDDDEVIDLSIVPAKIEAKPDMKPETPKAATPSSVPPPDDIVITTEEIVIEIDD